MSTYETGNWHTDGRKTRWQKRITASWLRDNRRTVGVLYRLLRARLGLTQVDMGRLLGISRACLAMRERSRRLYLLEELVALQELSGMTDQEFWSIIKEVAK